MNTWQPDPVSPGRHRLLIAEDEPDIREMLAACLRYAGFEVATAEDGREAVEAARRQQPDLLLLDVAMPGRDGFEVLRRLRAAGNTAPVVFLTARDAVEEKITGLRLGGDDYVTKPFSLEEVVARIHAVLRRVNRQSAGTACLEVADLKLDEDSHTVWRAGQEVHLSALAFKLLRFLMTNSGRVMSKPQILDNVWDYDFNGDAGIVETYISLLRRKVDFAEPKLIHTLRGVGYVLRVPHA
ncbi:response regulator transcription factor [Streptomyces xinghaiensis]|uniref:response regulator transcription factor n=1 Tax=Streptomyces xinghaiensis TaxID=1038928 RepID=UPI002E10BB55|nr:response regulator transcription factor [Streptomyces xinghaiensis]